MQCVLVSKAAYQSLAWPVMFSDLIARATSGDEGFSVVEASTAPDKTTPKDHATIRPSKENGLAYLLYQNF